VSLLSSFAVSFEIVTMHTIGICRGSKPTGTQLVTFITICARIAKRAVCTTT
jgi:hypothetical protein